LRLAVQVGGIGIYETDFEQDRTRFSPELCIILGLPAGTEMTHAEASRLFVEQDRAEVGEKVEAAAALADNGKWHGVHRVVRADGAIRWVSIQGRRFYRETSLGRRPVRSIGTVIDITHFRDTEASLRESELRLRLALDASQMGTFEVDIAGTQAIIDAREAQLLGLPEGTRRISVDALRARVPLEDLQRSDAKRQRLEQHNEAYRDEFRLRMPDGSERWLGAFAAIRSKRIYGVNFDITDRKRAELAVRESEARLRIATSGAALGLFERDVVADRTVWVNGRMYEIFGRTRADGPLSRQQFIEEYLHPDDADAFRQARNDALEKDGSLHAICRIRRGDRRLRWLQIDGRYEFTDTGKPTRLVGVIMDITERKRLEQKSRALSERLIRTQEEERERIAQELHDSTAQHLVAANLILTGLRSTLPLQKALAKRWDALESSIAEAAKELRTFSYLLNPPILRDQGLQSAINQYIDGYASRSGLAVKLRYNPEADRLSFRSQRSVLRIVQEALANVHRHASASQVRVDSRCIAGRLHLTITDNGRELAQLGQRETLRPGLGLRSIEARVRQLAGKVRIQAGPHGTRVHASVPLHQTRSRKTS
jgi:PAS domain S-box-containing protein